MANYQKHSTEDILEVAKAFFEQYPEMPGGWSLTGAWGRRQISYVFIEGDGVDEMRAIVNSVDCAVISRGGHVIIDHSLKVNRKDVFIKAQMEIVDEPVEVSKTAEEKVLSAIVGPNNG